MTAWIQMNVVKQSFKINKIKVLAWKMDDDEIAVSCNSLNHRNQQFIHLVFYSIQFQFSWQVVSSYKCKYSIRTIALELVGWSGQEKFVLHVFWADAGCDSGLPVSLLDPVRQPFQLAVTVERVVTESPRKRNITLANLFSPISLWIQEWTYGILYYYYHYSSVKHLQSQNCGLNWISSVITKHVQTGDLEMSL